MAVVAAGAAALVPYVEALGALVAAELRAKPQILAEGALWGARKVRPDITEEDLALQLVEDDKLRALMFRVLDAGRRTAREDKLRWLGEVLGRVAADREKLDEGQIIVGALDALEGPQIAVLQVLAGSPPLRESGPPQWQARELGARVQLDVAFIQACLGTLNRHGLAVDAGRTAGMFGVDRGWVLTAFGRTVLQVVQAAEPPSSRVTTV